jgi:hypothetical protein
MPSLCCVGLALIVMGTFLPWLRSGTVERDSYASEGAIADLVRTNGFVEALRPAWPFLSVVCGLGAAALLIGYAWAGRVLAVVAAVAGGGVAIAVLGSGGSGIVSVSPAGPVVTIVGAAVVLVTVLITFATARVGSGRVR